MCKSIEEKKLDIEYDKLRIEKSKIRLNLFGLAIPVIIAAFSITFTQSYQWWSRRHEIYKESNRYENDLMKMFSSADTIPKRKIIFAIGNELYKESDKKTKDWWDNLKSAVESVHLDDKPGYNKTNSTDAKSPAEASQNSRHP